MRVLIIEDEERLAQTLASLLKRSGYTTSIAGDGISGLTLAESRAFDAVILDAMLPGMNGFDVLCRMRADGNDTPVMMLTARSELADRVQGLNAGADYYLTKPFENEELLACLRTILRRGGAPAPDVLSFGDLTLTPSVSSLSCGDRTVSLSARELDLMQLLIRNSGQLLSKDTILRKVWGYDSEAGPNSVEAYLSFLRKKLNLLSSNVRISVTRNLGYKLEVKS
ncbi:MAG: response regulator transcription factor [Clostridiales bacterium]|nr:response regulator transcription factor [Clostridiales bacterium]